ncbi:unnamed protein product, partial [Medioppia subpectinata]
NRILTESQRLERRLRIELRKQLAEENEKFSDNDIDATDSTTQQISDSDNTSTNDIDVNDYSSDSVPELQPIINDNGIYDKQNVPYIAIEVHECAEYSNNTVRQEPSLPVPIDRPITDYNNNFNETEFSHLNEMMFAVNHMQPNGAPAVTWEPIDYKEITECAAAKWESDVPLMVNMCRNLRAFNLLCESDQLSLIKYGGMEMLTLRTARFYDITSNSWILVMDSNNSVKISLDHMKLSLILFFNPNRPDLQFRHTVKYQRHVYTYLLKRSESEANARLLGLMNSFKDIRALRNIYIKSITTNSIQEFAKDYHVIAVDTRGYGDSGQPTGFLNYKVDKTIEDMCHLMNALNKRRIVLVGHGWGGIVSTVADQHNSRGVGDYMAFKYFSTAVIDASTIYNFFSLPTPLPEWALAGNDYFMLDYLYRTGDGRPLLADEHMEAYKYTFQQNGLTAPLNWYRANLAGRYPIRIPPKYLNIKVPTLLVWGKKDQLLSWKMAAAHRYVDDLTVHCIDNCSHWAAQECPDLVNQYMRKFLTHHSL